MKKTISLILAIVMISSVCLTGCGSLSGSGVDQVNSYMVDDNTVVAMFRNETNRTITHVSGRLNLYTGSDSNQNAIKSPSFSWDGSCSKGDTFIVYADVHGAPAGLADEVNRIGFHISEIR